MSSRALRKLQREQDERKQWANLQKEEEGIDGNDDENIEDEHEGDNLPVVQSKSQKINAFEFLNEDSAEDGNDADEQSENSNDNASDNEAMAEVSSFPNEPEGKGKATSKKKSKKRKKKRKVFQSDNATPETQKLRGNSEKLDEIDLALKSLELKRGPDAQTAGPGAISEDLRKFYEVLATESKNLNALNEMKKLFGSTVLEGEAEGAAAPARRRGRGPQQLDLGGALAGRNNVASKRQGLAGLALRKNAFMLGKEEWPKATSGGLGMEVVEKAWDFTTEYRFVHNPAYQDIQRQFDTCVESMDPQRMIQLLQFNPYHISTLLQVSEIAKQQGDNSVSGDLLERALFTFGRSVHSSFHTALAEGKARFDFRRPENREFWQAAWRYIGTLGQRGTWRTAYEWAKLLLSLDPEDDPYCIRMIIDQLAIRGGQFEHFLKLASTDIATINWGQRSPNIEISSALAHHKLKHAVECRSVLAAAVQRYPWIFAQLFRELNIDRIPKSVWGHEPRNLKESVECAAYSVRAKDIWNTPEALSLLVEVVETTSSSSLVPPEDGLLTPNVARHILLSDIPRLISLLPRSYTSEQSSSSDPLPPDDNILSYNADPNDLDDSLYSDEIPDDGPSQAPQQQGFFAILNGFMRQLGLSELALNGFAAQTPVVAANGPIENNDVAPESAANAVRHNRQHHNRQHHNNDDEEDTASDLSEDPVQTAGQDTSDTERVRQLTATHYGVDGFNDLTIEQLEAMLNNVDAEITFRNTNTGVVDPPDAPQAAAANASNGSESTGASPADDEDAAQRWLVGRGLQSLKAWTQQHGTDPDSWAAGADAAMRPLHEYVEKLAGLSDRAKRNFVVEYGLPQSAGPETKALVQRTLAAFERDGNTWRSAESGG